MSLMLKLIPNCWLIILLIFSNCKFLEQRQSQRKLDKIWPTKYSSTSPLWLANVGKGYVLKKNNDTLKGYIKLPAFYNDGEKLNFVPLLPFNKTKKEDILETKLEDIDWVRIKWSFYTDTFDYIPIKSVMWRILYRRDQIKVCYQEFETGEFVDDGYSKNEMMLVSGKDTAEFPILETNILHKRKYFIMQFINKRYKQNFNEKDFKDENAMINYIFDKEIEKQSGK